MHDLERGSVDTGAAALSQAPLGTTTGAAAFNPLRQNSKNADRGNSLTSKASITSDVSRKQSPAISPKKEEINRPLASQRTDLFTGYHTHNRMQDQWNQTKGKGHSWVDEMTILLCIYTVERRWNNDKR